MAAFSRKLLLISETSLQFFISFASSKHIFNAVKKSMHPCKRFCQRFGTNAKHFQSQRRKRVQDQSNTEFMEDEIKKYESGKRWLAKMMGADAETFTDNDVEEALRYLLPSKLFAKDARPLMKHPKELFPESKSMLSDERRPIHPAFYTGATAFHDLLYDIFSFSKLTEGVKRTDTLEVQMEKETVEVEAKDDVSRKNINPGKLRWLHHNELQIVLNEELSHKNYEVIIHRLKKLAHENWHHNSVEVLGFLEKFQTPVLNEGSQFMPEKVDEQGRAHGRGYRKRAMAEVWVSNGSGKIIVNDIPLLEYFVKQEDRNQVWHPLITLKCMDKFDVECNVIGGGTTGQAGAIRLAISRALTGTSNDFLPSLRQAGLLTRDRRLVERKKPGQKKARKKFAWVKR